MTPAGYLEAVSPGLASTIQDFGRTGYQALGVPVSGASDPLAFRVANALVGNPSNMAAIEICYMGPTLVAQIDAIRVGVAGNVSVRVIPAGSQEVFTIKPWRSVLLRRGDRMALGAVEGGTTAYLAVAGGFAIGPTMGSLSTLAKSGLGGFRGRSLQPGDQLPLMKVSDFSDERELSAPLEYGKGPIRVILGPQDERFTPVGIETFLTSSYTVSNEADRMGLRLSGAPIEHVNGAGISSEGIAAGSVQVPGSGLPIILMADRQTVGGYTKIATIISADLPRVAQLKPGAVISFVAIDVDQAQAIRRTQEVMLLNVIGDLRAVATEAVVDLNMLYCENLISGAVNALSGAA